jgi:hypothetical protein|tara:strand:- start:2626 stop:3033 length:408 start_codon:yes stop_codon:yes gene_type:complete
MNIEISNGELLDKVAILKIKLKNVKDLKKQEDIRKEHDSLAVKMTTLTESLFEKSDTINKKKYLDLFDKLLLTNEKLWLLEDRIREKESRNMFDEDFIEIARAIYYTNDIRFKIKQDINELTKSNIVEVKEHPRY